MKDKIKRRRDKSSTEPTKLFALPVEGGKKKSVAAG
jgi:hypothetical protein